MLCGGCHLVGRKWEGFEKASYLNINNINRLAAALKGTISSGDSFCMAPARASA